MIKKTSRAIKNYQLFLFFLLAPMISAFAVTPESNLKTADSLFQAKKYTESYEIYESLYNEQHMYSQAMLLKMAFIKEGLGDYSNALYYLHIYFKKTLDTNVLTKIDEIVEDKQLKGYGGDIYLKEFVYKYLRIFLAGVLALLFVVLIFSARYAGKGKSPVLLILILIIIIPLTFAINYDFQKKSAIVMEDTSYLMDGPSGSANVTKTINRGHKVIVQKSKGVWSRITWDNQTFYIRKSKLKELI